MPVVAASTAAAVALAAAQAVTFNTKDGWTLAAKYRPAAPGKAVVVLAHGVGSASDEWASFGEDLARRGIGTLAVDLRGHSGSQAGPSGPRAWPTFDATGEWPRAAEDLRAAAGWLEKKGVPAWRIGFGGASVGADLASVVAAERKSAPFLLLLSLPENYRGAVLKLRKGLPTLAAAAPADGYSYIAVRRIEAEKTGAVRYAPAGHGVQMLSDPATLKAALDWVASARLTPPAPAAPKAASPPKK